MKVIKEGHLYEMEGFDNPENVQTIQFIEKTLLAGGKPGELVTVNDGTTNEELLAVLVNRMQSLNKKFPCRENSIVITKLEESLIWMNKRTKEREQRGVEGKALS